MKQQTRTNLILLGAILLMLALVGMIGFKDDLRQQREYCNNVANGAWPDYKNIYDEKCTDAEIEKINKLLEK